MVRKHLPSPAEGNMIFVCGPGPMMNSVSGGKAPKGKQGELSGALKAAGHTAEGVFKF